MENLHLGAFLFLEEERAVVVNDRRVITSVSLNTGMSQSMRQAQVARDFQKMPLQAINAALEAEDKYGFIGMMVNGARVPLCLKVVVMDLYVKREKAVSSLAGNNAESSYGYILNRRENMPLYMNVAERYPEAQFMDYATFVKKCQNIKNEKEEA